MISRPQTDMERLSAIVDQRLQELLLLRAFVASKGLEKEFNDLHAKAIAVSTIARGEHRVK